jgi:hypothetical protein
MRELSCPLKVQRLYDTPVDLARFLHEVNVMFLLCQQGYGRLSLNFGTPQPQLKLLTFNYSRHFVLSAFYRVS